MEYGYIPVNPLECTLALVQILNNAIIFYYHTTDTGIQHLPYIINISMLRLLYLIVTTNKLHVGSFGKNL